MGKSDRKKGKSKSGGSSSTGKISRVASARALPRSTARSFKKNASKTSKSKFTLYLFVSNFRIIMMIIILISEYSTFHSMYVKALHRKELSGAPPAPPSLKNRHSLSNKRMPSSQAKMTKEPSPQKPDEAVAIRKGGSSKSPSQEGAHGNTTKNFKDTNPPDPFCSAEEEEVDNPFLSRSDGDKKPPSKKKTSSQEDSTDSEESYSCGDGDKKPPAKKKRSSQEDSRNSEKSDSSGDDDKTSPPAKEKTSSQEVFPNPEKSDSLEVPEKRER